MAEICLLNGLETYNEVTQKEMYYAQMRIIAKFIFEGFGFLTPQEITNAFHLNLQGKYSEVFKQYGKREINCEFIGQVLSAYKAYKETYINSNEDLLQVIHPPMQLPPPKEWSEEDEENERRHDINRAFTTFLTDPDWNYKLMDHRFYNQLVKDGALHEDLHKRLEKNVRLELLREKQKLHLSPSSFHKGEDGSIVEKHYDNTHDINKELHQLRNGMDIAVDVMSKQKAVKLYFEERLADGGRLIYVAKKESEK